MMSGDAGLAQRGPPGGPDAGPDPPSGRVPWPPAVAGAARLLLASPQPLWIAWGPDLLLIPNDAALPYLPEGPADHGRPAAEVWPEARDLLEAARQGTPAQGTRRLLLPRDGRLRELQADFALSPLPGEDGASAGVIGILSDRTSELLSRRRRALLAALAGPATGGLEALHARCLGAFAANAQADLVFGLLYVRGRDGALALGGACGIAPDDPAAGPGVPWPFAAALGAGGPVIAAPPEGLDLPRGPWADPPHAVAVVPIPGDCDREPAGLLVAGLAPALALDDALEAFLRLLAAQLGGALAAARAAEAARALAAREALTRGILEASLDGIVVLDLDGTIRFMSPAGLRAMRARDASEFEGLDWAGLWPPASRGRVRAALARAVSGRAGSFRATLPSPSGAARHWDVVVTPIAGQDGRPDRLLSVARDVTAQRRTEESLRESEARFRAMADSAPVMVWTTDAEGACTYVNRRWTDVTGRSEAEALGWGYRTAIHPQDREAAGAVFVEARALRQAFRTEYRLARADGGHAHVIDEGVPRLGAGGELLGFVGSVTDITELREAEDRRALLVNELNHRVKNTLATVQSLAAQSFRMGPEERPMREVFESRLVALSGAHDLLTRASWEGASLPEVAVRALAPFGVAGEGGRLRLSGPDVRLPPRMVLALAMALHELATNAVKYGALTRPEGRVDLDWSVTAGEDGPRLSLAWAESGGPRVEPPRRRGFGSRLIETGLAAELGGEATMDYPESGLICRLNAPLPPEGTE